MKLKLTIVTPVYNGEKYIEQTIKSIISQTTLDYQYIVVDGGSTDNSRKIIKKYKKYIDKIIFKKDKSMYEALRTGFSYAKGDYLCWINSDDYLIEKNSIKNLIRVIKKTNALWLTCNTAIANKKQKPKIFFPLSYPRFIIKNGFHSDCYWGFIQQENTIFSKKLYQKVNGINPSFRMAGDYDLWKRLSKYTGLTSIKINFACHRKSEGQLTDLDKYYEEIKQKRCKFKIFYPFRFIYSLIRYPLLTK